MRDKIQKAMKGAGKYVAIGGALSLGAEGASALVRHAEGSPNMQDSERIEFTDWGPSVFCMDSVETAPKSKWPLSMITWMLIAVGVCLFVYPIPENPKCPHPSLPYKTSLRNQVTFVSPSLRPPCHPQ